MTREIKFRGKVKHHDPMINPEIGWVEGYYVQDLAQGEMRSYIFQSPCCWEVILETIGQFTGLYDKNGKEIYEGDIVHLDSWKPNAMQIKFIEAAFCLADENGEYLGDIHYIQHAQVNQCTVLGNIHDNPELLKGGANRIYR